MEMIGEQWRLFRSFVSFRGKLGDAACVFLVFMLAGLAGMMVVRYRHATRTAHPVLSLSEMRKHVVAKDALILDARPMIDFSAGHIPGACSLSVDTLHARLSALEDLLRVHRDRLVLVYCSNRWCGQADELQAVLIAFGHRLVGIYPEGYDEWLAAGFPVLRAE